jgi:uncharacterized Zn-finger protein
MTKIFTCNLCNKEFNRKYNLNKHMERKNPCVKKEEVEVEEEEEKKIKCEFCNKFYKHNFTLTRHLKTCKVKCEKEKEEEDKKLKCEFCNKSYKQKQHLTRHLKTCKIKQEKEEPTIKELELEIKLAKITFKSLKLEEEMKLMKSQIEENSKIIKFFMEDFIIRRGGNSSQI